MRERPILFSAPMVRATLDGRKTQTRRVVKLPEPSNGYLGVNGHGDHVFAATDRWGGQLSCPYGVPGDLLWVRESFAATPDIAGTPYLYRADLDDDGTVPYLVSGTPMGGGVGNARVDRWRPSIHMPRRASRITLRITDVRVERLTDISREDAEAEGLFAWSYPDCDGDPRLDGRPCEGAGFHWREPERERDGFGSPIAAYRDLWEHINGRGSWDENPWVWAVTFERVTP